MRGMLTQWCTNVMRSRVEPMKALARMLMLNPLEIQQSLFMPGACPFMSYPVSGCRQHL